MQIAEASAAASTFIIVHFTTSSARFDLGTPIVATVDVAFVITRSVRLAGREVMDPYHQNGLD